MHKYKINVSDYIEIFNLNFLGEDLYQTIYYKFVSKDTQNYIFKITNFSGYDDLYLTLLDQNFDKIISGDDSRSGYLPELTYNLVSNQIYYFQLKQINSAPNG